jgi:hypothetical protein
MDYGKQWREYRNRRNIFLTIWLAGAPVTAASAILAGTVFPGEVPVYVIAGLWILAFVIAGQRVILWKCPRCGKWFAATYMYNMVFLARKCVHCGLPKWAGAKSNTKN